jgi:hypothetical protein
MHIILRWHRDVIARLKGDNFRAIAYGVTISQKKIQVAPIPLLTYCTRPIIALFLRHFDAKVCQDDPRGGASMTEQTFQLKEDGETAPENLYSPTQPDSVTNGAS